MDASRRTECLTNTRTDVLEFVVDWANNSDCQQNVLWVHGPVGSGKSTLSTTIASLFRERGQLGAFLFFDRDVSERSDPTIVIRTIAYQLAASITMIRDAIGTTLNRYSTISTSPLRYQFQRLILDVLSTVELPVRPIIIVMDALDECGTSEEREALLAVMSEDFANLPIGIRIIITSRTLNDIRIAFEPQHHILAYELDILSPGNSEDILTYFH